MYVGRAGLQLSNSRVGWEEGTGLDKDSIRSEWSYGLDLSLTPEPT